MDLVKFIFAGHLALAAESAVLFTAGLCLAWPIVRFQLRAVQAPALAIFRMVVRLIGTQPSLLRMTLVIFLFNGSTMFLYMTASVHPLIPKLIAVVTGANVAMVFLNSERVPGASELGRPGSTQWVPSGGLTLLCSLVVVLLELPCFWYAIAMGMSLGQEVAAGTSSYGPAFEVRGRAYGAVLIPLLFLSAVCESIAVRGAGGLFAGTRRSAGPTDGTPER